VTNGGRVRDLSGVVHEWKPTMVGSFEEERTNCGRFFLAGHSVVHYGWWTYTDDGEPITCHECK